MAGTTTSTPLSSNLSPSTIQSLSSFSLSLSKKPHLLILLLQGSVDDRRGTGVASRHASPRRASLCHEAARTQRSGLRHRAGLQIRSSHHVRAVSLTKGEPCFSSFSSITRFLLSNVYYCKFYLKCDFLDI